MTEAPSRRRVEAFLGARHVQPARADPWGVEHVAVEQVLDQRDVVQRELADEQDVQADALGEGIKDAADPTEVDRVLHRAAPHDDPDRDRPSSPRRDPVLAPEQLEDLQEGGAIEQLGDRDDPGGEHAETPRVQPAGQVLREHGETFLGLVVARQSDRQQLQGLPGAVLVGHDVGADLVVQQGLDTVRPDGGGRGDEQPAERHHELGDVVAHVDVRREVRIDGSIAIDLRTSRVREHPSRHAAPARSLLGDDLEQLLRGRDERRGDPSVELQRSVQEPRGVAILQGGDLPCYLVSLRVEQGAQRRVGDVLDLEVVELASHQVRLEVELPEPQSGRGREVTPLEVRPRFCRVDRRDVEQQIHSALDLGEAGVDVHRGRKLLGPWSHCMTVPTPAAGSPMGRAGSTAAQPTVSSGGDGQGRVQRHPTAPLVHAHRQRPPAELQALERHVRHSGEVGA